MKKWLLLVLLWFLLLSSAIGNSMAVEVYQLKDNSRNIDIEQASKSEQFSRVDDISSLNFGIYKLNYWLKIVVKNTFPNSSYKLVLLKLNQK